MKGINLMVFCRCLCWIELSLPLTDAIRLRVTSCDVKDFIVFDVPHKNCHSARYASDANLLLA